MKKKISLLASCLIVLAVCFVSCGGSSSNRDGVEQNYVDEQDGKQEQGSIVGKWEATDTQKNWQMTFIIEKTGDFSMFGSDKNGYHSIVGKCTRNGNKLYIKGKNDDGKGGVAVFDILSLDRNSLVITEEGNKREDKIGFFTRME